MISSLGTHESVPLALVLSCEDPTGEPRIAEEQQPNMAVIRMSKPYGTQYWQFERMVPSQAQHVVDPGRFAAIVEGVNRQLRPITDEYRAEMWQEAKQSCKQGCVTSLIMQGAIWCLLLLVGGGILLSVLNTGVPSWVGTVLMVLGGLFGCVVVFGGSCYMILKNARKSAQRTGAIRERFNAQLGEVFKQAAQRLTSEFPGTHWAVRDAIATVVRTRTVPHNNAPSTHESYTAKVRVQYLLVAFNGMSCPSVPPQGGYVSIDGRLHGGDGGVPHQSGMPFPQAMQQPMQYQQPGGMQVSQPMQYQQPGMGGMQVSQPMQYQQPGMGGMQGSQPMQYRQPGMGGMQPAYGQPGGNAYNMTNPVMQQGLYGEQGGQVPAAYDPAAYKSAKE